MLKVLAIFAVLAASASSEGAIKLKFTSAIKPRTAITRCFCVGPDETNKPLPLSVALSPVQAVKIDKSSASATRCALRSDRFWTFTFDDLQSTESKSGMRLL